MRVTQIDPDFPEGAPPQVIRDQPELLDRLHQHAREWDVVVEDARETEREQQSRTPP